MSPILASIYNGLIHTSWLEAIAVISGIVSVWYSRKENVLVFPTGLLNTTIYIYLSLRGHLIGEASVNLYYTAMSIYGWYNWALKTESQYIYPISWCNKKELNFGVILFLLFWVAIYFILIKLTNSNTPVLDSLVSSTAVTSMWWMAKRKMENWIAWIISNLVAIPLNFYKGLILFTLMYVLFLALAVSGYKEWKSKLSSS